MRRGRGKRGRGRGRGRGGRTASAVPQEVSLDRIPMLLIPRLESMNLGSLESDPESPGLELEICPELEVGPDSEPGEESEACPELDADACAQALAQSQGVAPEPSVCPAATGFPEANIVSDADLVLESNVSSEPVGFSEAEVSSGSTYGPEAKGFIEAGVVPEQSICTEPLAFPEAQDVPQPRICPEVLPFPEIEAKSAYLEAKSFPEADELEMDLCSISEVNPNKQICPEPKGISESEVATKLDPTSESNIFQEICPDSEPALEMDTSPASNIFAEADAGAESEKPCLELKPFPESKVFPESEESPKRYPESDACPVEISHSESKPSLEPTSDTAGFPEAEIPPLEPTPEPAACSEPNIVLDLEPISKPEPCQEVGTVPEPKPGPETEVSPESKSTVRRSSRIKTLEKRRGGQRRREVVFAPHRDPARNSAPNLPEDDSSSSNSNLPSLALSVPAVSIDSGSLGSPRDGDGCPRSGFQLSPTSLLKLKSRWLATSEEENLQESDPLLISAQFEDNLNLVKRAGYIFYDEGDTDLPEKLTKFSGIDENVFKSAHRSISKESRGLLCDCYLSRDEIARGEIGCNENCLNRLLMVECGARCPTGDRCTNRKFQRREYCKLEVFKTERKGHGLRTRQGLPSGGFVIEYVGEVLDPREFGRRTKEYAKENQEHFYFMALKSDSIIDATQRGNCSRFINHSCEPNCETQKWTVGGELRIGFFAIRDLSPGEEITFDYQFQRYGKEAQKCFCLAPTCRGWIGGDENEEEGNEAPEEEDHNEAEAEAEATTVVRPRVKRRYVRKQKKAEALEDMAFEEELSKLAVSGLRNKNQTLSLCRLMVRAEKWEARERILKILIQGDTPCRRLFLDYHGLRLIWGWMMSLPMPLPDEENKLESDDQHKLFLKTLYSLPIPNKSMLQDSKVLSLIEKWSHATPITTKVVKVIKPEVVESAILGDDAGTLSVPAIVSEAESLTTTVSAIGSDAETVTALTSVTPSDSNTAATVSSDFYDPLAMAQDAESDEMGITFELIKPEEDMEIVPKTEVAGPESAVAEGSEIASSVIKEEVEAIPEVVKEETILEEISWDFVNASKDLLASWSGLQEVFRIPKKERVEQMKEHEREADKADRARSDSDRDRTVSSSYDRGSTRYRTGRIERRLSSSSEHHREQRPRENFYRTNRTLLGSDAYSNLSKEERRNLFAAKVAAKEAEEKNQRITNEVIALHQERCLRLGLDSATTPMADPSCTYFLDPASITWREINIEDPSLPQGLRVIVQSALFPPQMMFPEQPLEVEAAEEELFPPWPQGLLPPPPLPPTVLPKYWKMNVDEEGRCYYYDVRTRRSQWTPPSPTDDNSESEDSGGESEEESESVGGATTSGDESGISVSEDVPEDPVCVVQKFTSWMTNRAERRKRSGLVTERIISPRSEEEKSLSFVSQSAIRENKLEVAGRGKKKIGEKEICVLEEEGAGQGGSNVSLPDARSEIYEGPLVQKSEGSSPAGLEGPPGNRPSPTDSASTEQTNASDSSILPDIQHLHLDESLEEDPLEKSIPGLESSTDQSFEEEIESTEPFTSSPGSSTLSTKAAGEERHAKRRHKKAKHAGKAQAQTAKEREKEKMSNDRKTKAANIEAFRSQIANVIVQHLNPYRKASCKNGHISSTEDFKHLARKMTHAIALKEMKHSKDGKTILVNESVKHKTREYVKKYMGRFQGKYARSPDDMQS